METQALDIDLEQQLKKWFGYNAFRPLQQDIIENILKQKDVLTVLPTGAGKSLCYQLPAVISSGTAVVISPLISLMQDQVNQLKKAGISAAYVNSSIPPIVQQDILDNLICYKLLYIAPERLQDSFFLKRLHEAEISFFVIDEAHCISQWGHSFRPDYRTLSLLKTQFSNKPIMALTATATVDVEKDIINALSLKDPYIAKASFDRPNLMIRAERKEKSDAQVKTFLAKHKNESGIIYAATRKNVDMLYDQLKNEGYLIAKYHAGLSENERHEALENFIHDKVQLMVATVAFGMGINKPDVRFVLHYDMPETIERYYQEIGRAGRDGLPASCLMLFSGKELMVYNFFSEEIEDEKLRKEMKRKTERMYAFCNSVQCRRVELLNYFGEKYLAQTCTECDNCVSDESTIDGTIIAQKILSCVKRLQEKFGVRHVIDVLRGSKNSNVLTRGHDQLSTYGLLKDSPEAEVRYYINSLISQGYLKTSSGDYPVLQCTETSLQALKGDCNILFRKKIFKEILEKAAKTTLAYNQELFDILRKLRLNLARENNIPPYVIFNDKTLYEMATYFPKTDNEFLSINGVGSQKLAQYGTIFLEEINAFCKK